MRDQFPDRIILGQNQFFGINHYSAKRGANTAEHFSDLDKIIDLIRFAQEMGAGGIMLSTHPRAEQIAKALIEDPDLKDFGIYILLPYMAKYIRRANERGLINMVFEMLETGNLTQHLRIGIRGGFGVLKQDPISLLKAAIDLELMPFRGLNIKAVLLHNALTDLAVGLGASELLRFFTDYLIEDFHVNPGFCTLTGGLVMRYIDEIGIKNPVIMASFNPVGFQMSPSKKICEDALRTVPAQVIAMSTLAAGFVSPRDASAYLSTKPEIKSVVVGASSKVHITESFKLLSDAIGSN